MQSYRLRDFVVEKITERSGRHNQLSRLSYHIGFGTSHMDIQKGPAGYHLDSVRSGCKEDKFFAALDLQHGNAGFACVRLLIHVSSWI